MLRRSGEPYTLAPTALARWMTLSSAAMTNRVDRLEAAGLVERHPDPGDRRGVLVVLPPDGRRVVYAADTDHVEYERRLLEPLSEDERRTLNALLRKILLGWQVG